MAIGNQVLGKGKIRIASLVAGVPNPANLGRYVGNTPAFNVSIDSETLDHFSSEEGIREKDKSVVVETTSSGSLTMDDIQPENLALFFFGSASVIAQTSASTQTFTVEDVVQGYKYQVGATQALPTGVRSLTDVVVKVAAAAKVLNTDYTLDAERGTITIIEGGGIATGDDVTVEYSRSAVSRSQVISGSQQIEVSIHFEATNPEGLKRDFFLPKVKISPNGDFELKGEDWQQIPFNLEILKATGYERIYADGLPYTVS